MHIVPLGGEYYVKLEVLFDTTLSGGIEARFNISLLNLTSDISEYTVWDGEMQPEATRRSESESEILRAMLDNLLTDRYIDLDTGLLENIGLVAPNQLYVGFNEREGLTAEQNNALQNEIETLIKQAVANFVNGMATI